jgi:uncharacterized protein (DUF433 family)
MAKSQLIRVKQFVNDLRDGLTNAHLMQKYNLSQEQLNRTFQQLIDRKAMSESELRSLAMRRRSTVDVRVFAADLEAGMDRQSLMTKYRLNSDDYHTMVRKARAVKPVPASGHDEVTVHVRQHRKRRINAREFAEDVQLGMDHNNLITKYDITPNQLDLVLKKLVASKLLTEAEVYDRTVPFDTQLLQAEQIAQASIDELE